VADARRYVRAHRAEVVLDVNMPGDDSLEANPEIVAETPATAVVVLTMQSDTAFARSALRAGAKGYVLKEAADDELVQAVRAAANGETYLNPRLGAHGRRNLPSPADYPTTSPSARSRSCGSIVLGHTNSEIIAQLYLSVRRLSRTARTSSRSCVAPAAPSSCATRSTTGWSAPDA
jgi:two-component system response regulator NreC